MYHVNCDIPHPCSDLFPLPRAVMEEEDQRLEARQSLKNAKQRQYYARKKAERAALTDIADTIIAEESLSGRAPMDYDQSLVDPRLLAAVAPIAGLDKSSKQMNARFKGPGPLIRRRPEMHLFDE